jgi:hypothetical protein
MLYDYSRLLSHVYVRDCHVGSVHEAEEKLGKFHNLSRRKQKAEMETLYRQGKYTKWCRVQREEKGKKPSWSRGAPLLWQLRAQGNQNCHKLSINRTCHIQEPERKRTKHHFRNQATAHMNTSLKKLFFLFFPFPRESLTLAGPVFSDWEGKRRLPSHSGTAKDQSCVECNATCEGRTLKAIWITERTSQAMRGKAYMSSEGNRLIPRRKESKQGLN